MGQGKRNANPVSGKRTSRPSFPIVPTRRPPLTTANHASVVDSVNTVLNDDNVIHLDSTAGAEPSRSALHVAAECPRTRTAADHKAQTNELPSAAQRQAPSSDEAHLQDLRLSEERRECIDAIRFRLDEYAILSFTVAMQGERFTGSIDHIKKDIRDCFDRYLSLGGTAEDLGDETAKRLFDLLFFGGKEADLLNGF